MTYVTIGYCHPNQFIINFPHFPMQEPIQRYDWNLQLKCMLSSGVSTVFSNSCHFQAHAWMFPFKSTSIFMNRMLIIWVDFLEHFIHAYQTLWKRTQMGSHNKSVVENALNRWITIYLEPCNQTINFQQKLHCVQFYKIVMCRNAMHEDCIWAKIGCCAHMSDRERKRATQIKWMRVEWSVAAVTALIS